MPMFGQTAQDRVSALVAEMRTDILARCAGAVDVAMERGPGRVWVGASGGPHVVETVDDYVIVVTLKGLGFVPRQPISYDGVPLRFDVP